jgi:hypothetical protein
LNFAATVLYQWKLCSLNFPVPMIQALETNTALRAGAAPQPSQFVRAPAAAMQTQPFSDKIQIQSKSVDADKTGDCNEIIPTVAQPTPAAEKQAQPSMNSVKGQSGSISADKTSIDKEMNDDSGIIASTAQLAPGNREADTTFLK